MLIVKVIFQLLMLRQRGSTKEVEYPDPKAFKRG
jgi:hypothetical protein